MKRLREDASTIRRMWKLLLSDFVVGFVSAVFMAVFFKLKGEYLTLSTIAMLGCFGSSAGILRPMFAKTSLKRLRTWAIALDLLSSFTMVAFVFVKNPLCLIIATINNIGVGTTYGAMDDGIEHSIMEAGIMYRVHKSWARTFGCAGALTGGLALTLLNGMGLVDSDTALAFACSVNILVLPVTWWAVEEWVRRMLTLLIHISNLDWNGFSLSQEALGEHHRDNPAGNSSDP